MLAGDSEVSAQQVVELFPRLVEVMALYDLVSSSTILLLGLHVRNTVYDRNIVFYLLDTSL